MNDLADTAKKAGTGMNVLGIITWRQFPLSGAWAIGVFLGIKLLFVGLGMITVGSTARAAAKA